MKTPLPTIYSQRDPKWSNLKLGFSIDTLGKYGCFITCDAMVANYYGIQVTPADINGLYKQKKLFNGNMRAFNALPLTYPLIKEKRVDTSTHLLRDSELKEINAALDKGYPVVICIDFNPATKSDSETHFVVVIDYDPKDENNYTIADPWDGKIKSLKAYLKGTKPTARRTIQSYRIFSGPVKPKTIDYVITWKEQRPVFIGEVLHERIFFTSMGETLDGKGVQLRIRGNKKSLFNKGIIPVTKESGLYRADIPIIVPKPRNIENGVYREDYELIFKSGEKVPTNFNVWFEIEVE